MLLQKVPEVSALRLLGPFLLFVSLVWPPSLSRVPNALGLPARPRQPPCPVPPPPPRPRHPPLLLPGWWPTPSQDAWTGQAQVGPLEPGMGLPLWGHPWASLDAGGHSQLMHVPSPDPLHTVSPFNPRATEWRPVPPAPHTWPSTLRDAVSPTGRFFPQSAGDLSEENPIRPAECSLEGSRRLLTCPLCSRCKESWPRIKTSQVLDEVECSMLLMQGLVDGLRGRRCSRAVRARRWRGAEHSTPTGHLSPSLCCLTPGRRQLCRPLIWAVGK